MAKKNELRITSGMRTLTTSKPFVPFDIKTADGDTFNAFHPDFIMILPDGEGALMYDKDHHFRILNLRMVVSVEPVRAKKGLLGQGGGKR